MKELVNATGKMTSVVIAEITGKNHGHLMRDIRKMEEAWVNLGQSKFGLCSYINENNRSMPMYELSKTECLYIATKFNDEARAKLVLRWQELEVEKQKPLSTLDMLEMGIKQLRAQEQRVNAIEKDVLELKAQSTTRPDYFTIVGYATLHKIQVGLHMAARLGGKAARLCSVYGYMTEEVPDPRFGKVKSYPRSVLDEVFASEVIS